MLKTDTDHMFASTDINPLHDMERAAGTMRVEDAAVETDVSVIERITYDWVLVCNTPLHEDEHAKPKKQPEFPRDVAPRDPLVRELKLLLHQLSLQVHGFPSARDSSRYFLQITATEDVLRSWAEAMKLHMRLATKASALLDKLHMLNEELRSQKRLGKRIDMKDLTKSETVVTLWVANLQDQLFEHGAKGTKAVEKALSERFSEFGQVVGAWVRFKRGDASSLRQENQSWALLSIVPESLSGAHSIESQQWEPDEAGLEMLKGIKLDRNAGPAQAAVLNRQFEVESLIVQHQRKNMHKPRQRRHRHQLQSDITSTREALQAERAKRAHAEFEGMAVFKADLQHEFQRNRARRVADSVFCSGERQQIIYHIIENEISGIDLHNSKAAQPGTRERVWKDMTFEKAGEAYSVMKTAQFDGQKISEVEHETRMHLIQNILVDESRDAGHAPQTEKHRKWLAKRMQQLNRATMVQLREWTRTWDCIMDFVPLHDFHEMEFLKMHWVERPVFAMVRRSLGVLGHPTAAGAPLRGELRLGQAVQALTFQPINEIRDYFGEKTAIYFAFDEFYTQSLIWPSLAGLLCVIPTAVWRTGDIEGYSFGFAYHVFISFWTVVFLCGWRRQQTALSHLWGTEHYNHFETARPQFLELARDPTETSHHFAYNPLTESMEPMAKYAWHRYAKMALSMMLLAFFFVLVFAGVMVAQWVKLGDPTRPALDTFWNFAGILLQVCLIGLFGLIYGRLSTATTDWEHHRTSTEYDSSQIAKVFAFDAVNNFFVLFFIAFLKGRSTITVFGTLDARNATCTSVKFSCGDGSLHQSLQSHCPMNNGTVVDSEDIEVVSCMNELWMQLLVVLSAGQIGIMALSWALPEIKYGVRRLEQLEHDLFGHKHLTAVGLQMALPEYTNSNRHKSFSNKAIQFGYVVLFAVALPTAPIFALINNWIELRSHAHNITTQYRRPRFETTKGIGTWLYTFEAIAMVAVITNAALISFVGGQSADMWMFLFTQADSMEEAHYEVLALPGSQPQRIQNENLWLVAGITEHVIFATRIAIAVIIPNTPNWVHVAKLQLQRSKAHRMKTTREAQDEQTRRADLQLKFMKQVHSQKFERRMTSMRLLVDAEKRSKE